MMNQGFCFNQEFVDEDIIESNLMDYKYNYKVASEGK
jgi:hypothetical protein